MDKRVSKRGTFRRGHSSRGTVLQHGTRSIVKVVTAVTVVTVFTVVKVVTAVTAVTIVTVATVETVVNGRCKAIMQQLKMKSES
jgi:hypothetical protein